MKTTVKKEKAIEAIETSVSIPEERALAIRKLDAPEEEPEPQPHVSKRYMAVRCEDENQIMLFKQIDPAEHPEFFHTDSGIPLDIREAINKTVSDYQQSRASKKKPAIMCQADALDIIPARFWKANGLWVVSKKPTFIF